MVDLPEGVTPFIQITQNDGLKQKKLKEEDISICECKYDPNDPDSACGEGCLNVHTSTECTPGYCSCEEHCKNQRFQRCEYVKSKLFKTDGRGWGLLADENIKADQFIIEYCGEVISSKKAKKRSQLYEAQGLKDAYIISLNTNYSIDATQKGSIARFINHSCQPNCETRKWTVLGETRVGIFAKEDIIAGTELAYNYNFEWYGGHPVKCLCGAPNCSIYLGAKSQGFQEYCHGWEDGDERYTVDKIPLYDSAEDDEHFREIPKVSIAIEANLSEESNVKAGPSLKRKAQNIPKRGKKPEVKQGNVKSFADMFTSKEVREEIRNYEEIKNKATSDLEALYDEIRPTIGQRERNNQESVPTGVAEKWISATCSKWKAEFNLHCSVIKNVMCPDSEKKVPSQGGDDQN